MKFFTSGGSLVKTQGRQPITKSGSAADSSGRRASDQRRDGGNERKLSHGDASSAGGFTQLARESTRKAFPHAAGQPLRFGKHAATDHPGAVVLHLAATGQIGEVAAERLRAHLRECPQCAADLDELKRRLAS